MQPDVSVTRDESRLSMRRSSYSCVKGQCTTARKRIAAKQWDFEEIFRGREAEDGDGMESVWDDNEKIGVREGGEELPKKHTENLTSDSGKSRKSCLPIVRDSKQESEKFDC